MPQPLECLQPLLFPKLATVNEPGLYFRGDFIVPTSCRSIAIKPYGSLRLDTYFNAFSVEKWALKTVVRTVQLEVAVAKGAGQLTVFHRTPTNHTRLARIDFDCNGPERFSFPFDVAELKEGIVYLAVAARSEVVLSDARYVTGAVPEREVRLGITITTFRREAEVAAAIERFVASRLPEMGHRLFVIDNGKTLQQRGFRGGCVLHNENLGGSGGFTRGLLEARRIGHTHALFMDDDAYVHVESIQKTAAFLRYATSDETAVCGAMLVAERPSMQFEAGARLRAFGPEPLKANRDMTEIESILVNEESDHIDYGAWWFFAFPIAQAKHLGFPFFVRGDDVMFSLANRFDIVSLTGVAVWHQTFENKISPSVEYLGHRADFLIGLIRAGRSGLPLAEFCRAALRIPYEHAASYRYGMAHARCDAMEDVLSGPAFFENEPSALGRLEEMKARYGRFFPQRVTAEIVAAARPAGKVKRKKLLVEPLRKLTLNGHLLPAAILRRPQVILEGFAHPARTVFGSRRALFVALTTGDAVSVERSLAEYIRVRRRLAALRRRILRDGERIIAAYEQALPYLQSEAYWRKVMALPEATAMQDVGEPVLAHEATVQPIGIKARPRDVRSAAVPAPGLTR